MLLTFAKEFSDWIWMNGVDQRHIKEVWKIIVVGHKGLVGPAMLRALRAKDSSVCYREGAMSLTLDQQ